jgi:hypothetical protein
MAFKAISATNGTPKDLSGAYGDLMRDKYSELKWIYRFMRTVHFNIKLTNKIVKKNPELIDRYIAATNGYGNIKDVIV